MAERSKTKRGRKRGSLVIVGTGYEICARITPEAAAKIENADTAFYLVYDWLDEVWLRSIKPDAVSLADVFKGRRTPRQCCQLIVQRVMTAVRKGQAVCMAFSGHPSICVDPTQTAFARARSEGFPVRMIPGISVLDCLFADLCLDPTTVSCRVFDATRFLLRRVPVDRSSGLVLLQIARIGRHSYRKKDVSVITGVKALQDLLIQSYGPRHKVIHYQTAVTPLSESIIEELPVSALHKCEVEFRSTLYVPPRP
jgi:uncharacterized protein YabN with tetrapyrrole methylase and pyrophosphatase domain